jgi:putative membrane protein
MAEELDNQPQIQPHNQPRTPRQYARIALTGMAMGIADLIPGVSGGTMAFILGIYEDLLAAIKSFSPQFVRLLVQRKFREALGLIPWRFLISLGMGLGLAVLLLASVMSWLWENERVYVLAFFFGLIVASIIAVGTHVKWSLTTGGMFVLGTAIALLIVNLLPLDMPHDPLTLFLSGSVAIMAMILPGISGSFILLILGQYDYVINALSDLDILAVLPVMLGSAVGLLLFARVLSWLLKRYHDSTVALLVGFMAGSLHKIWPWKEVLETRIDRHGEEVPLLEANVLPTFASTEFLIALLLCVVGFLVVSYLDHLQSKANPIFSLFGRKQRDVATAEQ